MARSRLLVLPESEYGPRTHKSQLHKIHVKAKGSVIPTLYRSSPLLRHFTVPASDSAWTEGLIFNKKAFQMPRSLRKLNPG